MMGYSPQDHCSKIVRCTNVYEIECVHCKAINFVETEWDSSWDVEEITCWNCSRDSLTSEDLMADIYTEYPDEAVSGHWEGKPRIELNQ